MYLFHFTVNSYGASWFVAAASRKAAIEAVRAGINAEYESERLFDANEYPGISAESALPSAKEQEEQAADGRDDNLKTLQCMIDGTGQYEGDTDLCSIDQYPVGHVIFSEVS